MGAPKSEKELKRFDRVLAGHHADKDRARWKRKASGEAKAGRGKRRPVADVDDDEPLDERDAPDEPR